MSTSVPGNFSSPSRLNKLTPKIERPKLSPEDIKKLEEGSRRSDKASE
jgi:hypothetical protein